MQPLKTETLELTLDNNIAAMSVTGEVDPDTLQKTIEWIETASNDHEDLTICVDMAKVDFDGLAAINKEFRNIGRVLRYAHDVDKVAVMSDSQFIRNTAEVEGSVIPGLEIKAYDLDEIAPATNWLSDDDGSAHQTQMQESVLLKQDNQEDTAGKIIDSNVSVAGVKTPEEPSDNPWDNLDVKAAIN
ncbi:STAS/SEC14 domain-containing protein [Litorimonas sp. RW-G-Af-16]|uniref:STAS/SEC14 domain-containing protein n=1 Tax=Litorimonas sp. RW-G-Af-16 TaxID=3241168 RepID=UPI00390C67A8